MKKFKTKLFKSFLLVGFLLISTSAIKAYDFKVGGICYKITGENTVEVTVDDLFGNQYTRNVKIPETVTYQKNTYTVTSIGDNVFYNCTGLTSVEIPNSVTSIPDNTFYYCIALSSVKLGNAVISIGDNAFIGCSALTNIEIPNSVISIGDTAFGGCSALTSIELPNSVTSIGDGAFNACSSLTSIEIPNSVTSIGEGTFGGCSVLASVEIPNSVTSIGDGAFNACSSLTSIEIPNSVITIEDMAFRACPNLKNIVIGSSVTSIGKLAFSWADTSSMEYSMSIENIECKAVVPPVCGENAFQTSPNALLYVPEESIDAYLAAPQWKDIHIYGVLVNGYRFNYNDLFFVINDAEKRTCSLVDGTSASGDIVISEIAVCEGNNLTVNSIDENAFLFCSNLTNIEIPNSVTYIGPNAFNGCSSLKMIELPEGLTSISMGLFANCTSLEKVIYPDNIQSFGPNAFNGCTSLRSFTVPNGITSIPDHFLSDSSITEIRLPNSVQSIGYAAFANCKALRNVVLGTGTYSIGNSAFVGCDNISDIYCMATFPPYAEQNTFPINRFSATTLYVPEESLAKYTSQDPWQRFTKINTMYSAIQLSHYEVEMAADEVFQLGVYGSDNEVTWTTSNPAVAYVNECGLVVARGVTGSAIITATVDGESVNCRVNITSPGQATSTRAGDYYLEPADMIVESIGGNPPMINLRLIPVGSKTVIDWRSSNPSIANVEDGIITITGEGNVEFSMETENGLTESIDTNTKEIEMAGVNIIFDDSAKSNDIYTLNGVCLKRQASQRDIETLAPGIYIINGRKVLVK